MNLNICILLLIKFLAGSSQSVIVQHKGTENINIVLMHIGLISGTPVRPRLAFSVSLLTFFYHLRRRQPSVGIQGFIKAVCTFQQVKVFLSLYSQLLLTLSISFHMFILWNNCFHMHLMSFVTYSINCKREWMWHLAAMPLIG
jgi:hypothetical protein